MMIMIVMKMIILIIKLMKWCNDEINDNIENVNNMY